MGDSSSSSRKSRIRCRPSSTLVAEEAVAGLLDAVGDVGLQRRLEATGLAERELLSREGHVDGAVEHQAPDPVGEQLGVRRAQLGAVGRAEVGQGLLAQGRPQDVHVARGLDGRDVARERTRQLVAPLGERVGPVGVRVALGGGVGVGILGEVGVEVVVAQAVDRAALAGAARVEADDVVGVEQRLAQHRARVGGVVGAGRARTAGVDDQRADPVTRGRHSQQREIDRVAVRVAVVEGHLERGALVAGVAVVPVQRLGVVRRERGVGRLGDRGVDRRPSPTGWGSTGRASTPPTDPGRGRWRGRRRRCPPRRGRPGPRAPPAPRPSARSCGAGPPSSLTYVSRPSAATPSSWTPGPRPAGH